MFIVRLVMIGFLCFLFWNEVSSSDLVDSGEILGGVLASWFLLEFFYRGLKVGFAAKSSGKLRKEYDDLFDASSGGYVWGDYGDD